MKKFLLIIGIVFYGCTLSQVKDSFKNDEDSTDFSTSLLDTLTQSSFGSSADNPVALKVAFMSLTPSVMDSIFSSIAQVKKYVSLDLHTCSGFSEWKNETYYGDGREYIVKLILPDSVTAISFHKDMFPQLAYLIGGRVTSLRSSPFNHNTKIEAIELPELVSLEDEFEFNGCSSLQYVYFPKLKIVPADTFQDCVLLWEIRLPEAIYVEIESFKGCSSLLSIVIPSVTSIGSKAFYNCTKLDIIVLGVKPVLKPNGDVKGSFYNTGADTQKGFCISMKDEQEVSAISSDSYWEDAVKDGKFTGFVERGY